MIWKYLPGIDDHIDLFVSIGLVFVCVLLIIFNRDDKTKLKNTEIVSPQGAEISKIEQKTGTIYIENVQGDKILNLDTDNVQIEENYLKVHIEKGGLMNLGGSKWGYGRLFSFTISNPTNRLAIVKRILLVVEKIDKDLVGGPEGQFQEYKYEVLLSPEKIGIYEIASNFKYGPGDVDKISIDIKTQEFGYDYLFRICVEWYDSSDSRVRTIKSELLRARFPKNHDPNSGYDLSDLPVLGLINIFEKKPNLLLENEAIRENPILFDIFTEHHEFWEKNPKIFLLYYKDTKLFLKLAKSCEYRLERIGETIEKP